MLSTKHIKPKQASKGAFHFNIESLFHLPANVFVQAKEDRGIACNDRVAQMIGFRDRREFAGLSYPDMAAMMGGQRAQYQSFRDDDVKVIQTGQPLLNICEPVLYSGDAKTPQYFVSNRFPLFDEQGQVSAVLGISFEVGSDQLMQSNLALQALLCQFPALTAGCSAQTLDQAVLATLSNQEQKLALQLIQGKTTKQAAGFLRISPRTAEGYVANMKRKLGCASKSMLIQTLLGAR